MFREEVTSPLTGYAGPLSWLNWNLEMLDFVEVGKQENPEKNPQSKARTNNKLYQHMIEARNRTWSTAVGGECSHHCAIPAPHLCL